MREEFRNLVQEAQSFLWTEYNNGKITEDVYEKVFTEVVLKALELSLTLDIDRKLKEQQLENMKQEIALKQQEVQAQIELTNAQISKVNSEISVDTKRIDVMEREMAAKEQEVSKEIELKNHQEALIDSQKELEDTKKIQVQKQTANIDPSNVNGEMYNKIQLLRKQKEMTDRQIQGFDDNLKQKLMEIQMNAWGMMFSSGLLASKPSIIDNDEVSSLYNNLKTQLGI